LFLEQIVLSKDRQAVSIVHTTHLMLGVRIKNEDFPGSIYDDRWLPYSEGHGDVSASILEDESFVYVGKAIADWDKYKDPESSYVEYVPSDSDRALVETFLRDNFDFECGDARLMFFVTTG
jgi:hypothetical protein